MNLSKSSRKAQKKGGYDGKWEKNDGERFKNW